MRWVKTIQSNTEIKDLLYNEISEKNKLYRTIDNSTKLIDF